MMSDVQMSSLNDTMQGEHELMGDESQDQYMEKHFSQEDRVVNLLESFSKIGQDLGNIVFDSDAEHLQALKNKLEELAAAKLPSYSIGVVGATGVGKTSLICALLQAQFLPTSSSRASTAAVTHIAYNPKAGAFRAEIHFLTEKEWLQDIKIAQQELSAYDDSPYPDSSREEAVIALSKLQAVYPSMNAHTLKMANPITLLDQLHGLLRQPMLISDTTNVDGFRDQLSLYVSTSAMQSSRQIWPLVKITNIWANCPFLGHGLILVDLPGNNDSNPARNKIAKEYLKSVDAVWIVSKIQRIMNDQTTNDYMNMITGSLWADGRTGDSVAIIATHADDPPTTPENLNTDESINLKLINYELTQLKSNVKASETRKTEIEKDFTALCGAPPTKWIELNNIPSSRDGPGGSVSGPPVLISTMQRLRNEFYKVDDNIKDYKLEKIEKIRQRHEILVIARNRVVKEFIQEDFLRRASTLTKDKQANLPVFTVATRDFFACTEQLELGEVGQVFPELKYVEKTEIPALRAYAKRAAISSRIGHLGVLLQEGKAFLDEIDLILDRNLQHLGRLVQHQLDLVVSGSLDLLQANLKAEISRSRFTSIVAVNDLIYQLNRDTFAAEESVVQVWKEIAYTIVYHNTYAATMRRGGQYHEYNFNQPFITPAASISVPTVKRILGNEMQSIIAKLQKEIFTCVMMSLEWIKDNCPPETVHTVRTVSDGIDIKHIMYRTEGRHLSSLKKTRRSITNSIPVAVEDILAPKYDAIAQESGLGMFVRMRAATIGFIENNKTLLYNVVRTSHKEQLHALVDDIYKEVEEQEVPALVALLRDRYSNRMHCSNSRIPVSAQETRQRLQTFVDVSRAEAEDIIRNWIYV